MESWKIFEYVFPKVGALLSLLGSSIIIAEVYQDWKSHNRSYGNSSRGIGAVSRALLSMSIGDIFFSLGWFMASWVVSQSENVLVSFEATQTSGACKFQGFILQFGFFASLCFNASLAIIYLLMVKYHTPQQKIAQGFQKAAILIWTISFVLALVPLILNLYHDHGPNCWLSPPPSDLPQCQTPESFALHPECSERKDVSNWLLVMQILPIWICIILDSRILYVIYKQTRQLEQEATASAFFGGRYNHNQPDHPDTKTPTVKSFFGWASSAIVSEARQSQAAVSEPPPTPQPHQEPEDLDVFPMDSSDSDSMDSVTALSEVQPSRGDKRWGERPSSSSRLMQGQASAKETDRWGEKSSSRINTATDRWGEKRSSSRKFLQDGSATSTTHSDRWQDTSFEVQLQHPSDTAEIQLHPDSRWHENASLSPLQPLFVATTNPSEGQLSSTSSQAPEAEQEDCDSDHAKEDEELEAKSSETEVQPQSDSNWQDDKPRPTSGATQSTATASLAPTRSVQSTGTETPANWSNRRSRTVAVQGLWYIGGFFFTYGLATISILYFLIAGKWNVPLYRASYFFIALQGAWNFLVFSKGRRDMKTWMGAKIKTLVWDYCCCCCQCDCLPTTLQFGSTNSPNVSGVTPPQDHYSNGKDSETARTLRETSNHRRQRSSRKGTRSDFSTANRKETTLVSVVSNASTVVHSNRNPNYNTNSLDHTAINLPTKTTSLVSIDEDFDNLHNAYPPPQSNTKIAAATATPPTTSWPAKDIHLSGIGSSSSGQSAGSDEETGEIDDIQDWLVSQSECMDDGDDIDIDARQESIEQQEEEHQGASKTLGDAMQDKC